MPHIKSSKGKKRRKKSVLALGAVGMLTVTGSAVANVEGPIGDARSPDHQITLNEEEVSDVSLGTFYVFDKETPSADNCDGSRRRVKAKAAAGCRCNCRGACLGACLNRCVACRCGCRPIPPP